MHWMCPWNIKNINIQITHDDNYGYVAGFIYIMTIGSLTRIYCQQTEESKYNKGGSNKNGSLFLKIYILSRQALIPISFVHDEDFVYIYNIIIDQTFINFPNVWQLLTILFLPNYTILFLKYMKRSVLHNLCHNSVYHLYCIYLYMLYIAPRVP